MFRSGFPSSWSIWASGKKVTQAQKEATKRYEDKAYDKALLRMPKGQKSEIQAAADRQGESFNTYVLSSVAARMKSESQEEK